MPTRLIDRLPMIVVATVFVLTASLASAQPGQGWGRGMGGGPMHYDKSTEVTLKGTVTDVLTHQGRAGMPMGMGGTHLMLKTDTGDVEVALGPTNWLAEKKYEFAKGDQIEVVGSQMTYDGKKTVVAREITKGGTTMTLRDVNGFPGWAGRGRRGQW